jgi:uncharacterized membrane protein YjgN (DUF898 family)
MDTVHRPIAPASLPGQVPSVGTAGPAAPQASPQPAGAAVPVAIAWSGDPWSLAGLSFLNFFLTVVTGGIYSFWGRTEVRRRIWSSVRLDGEPLEYTGTGKELFLGFLIGMAVVILPIFLISIGLVVAFGQRMGTLVQVGMYPILFYLVGVALYRARRYRLTRTNWRGIRGALVGNSWRYGWTSFWTAASVWALALGVLVAAYFYWGGPLGVLKLMPPSPMSYAFWLAILAIWLLITPWRANLLQRRLTSEMTFGSQAFSFTGSARALYARFIARWIGVIVLAVATFAAIAFTVGPKLMLAARTSRLPPGQRTELAASDIGILIAILLVAYLLFGIITAWYYAFQANTFASATGYEGARFRLDFTAGSLIWLFVTNFLITLFTLGILKPVAQARMAEYFISRLALDGPIDLARIAQSAAALSKTGEGLAQGFEIDAAF